MSQHASSGRVHAAARARRIAAVTAVTSGLAISGLIALQSQADAPATVATSGAGPAAAGVAPTAGTSVWPTAAPDRREDDDDDGGTPAAPVYTPPPVVVAAPAPARPAPVPQTSSRGS